MKTKVILAVLSLFVTVGFASAQRGQCNGQRQGMTQGQAGGKGCGMQGQQNGGQGFFIDENGDGICDLCGNENCAIYEKDGIVYGSCGNCGNGGQYFVDADGDGICDNLGSRVGAGNKTGIQGSSSMAGQGARKGRMGRK